MIDGMFSNPALQALERSMQFMSARQRILAGNLANVETPGYRPVDVDPRRFQGALAEALESEALERARQGTAGARTLAVDGGLAFDDAGPVSFTRSGVVLEPEALEPEVLADGILFHDGGDRSVERLMQRLTENAYAFRLASQLLRGLFETLNSAIRERP